MATTYQRRAQPMDYSTVRKSRTKQPNTKKLPPTRTNDSKSIQIRFGNNPSQNSMYKPPSILKKKPLKRPQFRRTDASTLDYYQADNPDFSLTRPFYSPLRTPPRLRTVITPPGVEPYRNRYGVRGFYSPLPTLNDHYSAPANLTSWGVNPTDYYSNLNLDLLRRYPSPLTQYGLTSGLQREKKPYIVVPDLTNFVSPPVSRLDGSFVSPARRTASLYHPNLHYTYLQRIHSFASPRFHREPSDYVHMRQNDAFANHYIEDFIGRGIEDEFIPDILLETIGELEDESKTRGGKSNKKQLERYYADLNQHIDHQRDNNTHLFSDEWVRELDRQHPPGPVSNSHSRTSSLRAIDFRERTPAPTTSRLRYHELPSDVQGRLLADVNQEVIDFELQTMMRELSDQTIAKTSRSVPLTHENESQAHHKVIHETHNSHHRQTNQALKHTVDTYAQDKILDPIMLDQLLIKYLRQHGSTVDVDDISRLLDATFLSNLIHNYKSIDESRSRTMDSYASRKLHLNSFMNITMDLLLTELSGSLVEDMKDLDEQKQRTS